MRDLSIALSKDKFEDWSDQIRVFIEDKNGLMKDLDLKVGRNGHASQTMHLGKHFNKRLRNNVLRCKNKKTQKIPVRLQSMCKVNLVLNLHDEMICTSDDTKRGK